jgi:radical SAM-linked protein
MVFLKIIMYRVSFSFSKKGLMRYISHLDLMRLFMRAMRRAELPLKMSEGFSPHPKLSLKRALKLGVESEHEEASIVLRFPVEPADFKDRLQKKLPEGIEVKDVQGNFN